MRSFAKVKTSGAYCGHPKQFWRKRKDYETKALVDVHEMKKLSDIVDYDSVHLQKLIINKTSEKVSELFNQEDIKLWQRRKRLKLLLEGEEEIFSEEFRRKQEMEEYNYCKERDGKINDYFKEIEEEKVRECFKALERQKIVNGMQCTRKDEVDLKMFQQLQIQEKKQIENENNNLELMWHHTMLDNLQRQEHQERLEDQRKHKEMLERRREYDEQISSANLKWKQAIQEERDKENKRLEIIKKRMAEDYYEALKKKKTQQAMNRNNFIEGQQLKLSRLRSERLKEREIDDKCIRDALGELRKERENKMAKMRNLQKENQVFIENYSRERDIALALNDETDKFANFWRKQEQTKVDEYATLLDKEKESIKVKNLQDYKNHLENVKEKMLKAKLEHHKTAENVRWKAFNELKSKIENADMEFKRQIDYRNSLTNQIMDNQKHLKSKLLNIERSLIPFTRKATMFKKAMEDKFNRRPARKSSNPVHPFTKAIESEGRNVSVQLPSI